MTTQTYDLMELSPDRRAEMPPHGFVELVDTMPRVVPVGHTADHAILRAARVSTGAESKGNAADRGLIRYLVRHRHCYHPNMEVLTSRGWKRWVDCCYEESFLVPNPDTRTLTVEKLPLDVFDAEEDMECFESARMSYCVTGDHRMWFKGKYRDKYEIVRAADMAKWGHFDPSAGYSLIGMDTAAAPLGRLVGFTLGDGSWSGNGLTFHLCKPRKKAYLRTCLADLGIVATESPSSTHANGVVFYVSAGDVSTSGLLDYVRPGERTADKRLTNMGGGPEVMRGIFDGLINSDGHINHDRGGRIEFSSASAALLSDFETLAAIHGFDAHGNKSGCVYAYPPQGTTLEARAKHFSTHHYRGKVYCATTSTGLLLVRGGPNKYAFVCGNTTPLEMVELQFRVRIPIFVARQWIRHRTASVSEESGRYTQLADEYWMPEGDAWRGQATTNRQASTGEALYGSGQWQPVNVINDEVLPMGPPDSVEAAAFAEYQRRIDSGVSREMARSCLPLSTYTSLYWKIDLHNFLHFTSLRMHSHAQPEIREFATAMYDMVQPMVPWVCEAFMDFHPHMGGMNLSRLEIDALLEMLSDWRCENAPTLSSDATSGEQREWSDKWHRLIKMEPPHVG